jgi:hypothetical protein
MAAPTLVPGGYSGSLPAAGVPALCLATGAEDPALAWEIPWSTTTPK